MKANQVVEAKIQVLILLYTVFLPGTTAREERLAMSEKKKKKRAASSETNEEVIVRSHLITHSSALPGIPAFFNRSFAELSRFSAATKIRRAAGTAGLFSTRWRPVARAAYMESMCLIFYGVVSSISKQTAACGRKSASPHENVDSIAGAAQ